MDLFYYLAGIPGMFLVPLKAPW